MGNYTIFMKFENPRRGRQARNFSENDPKILDLKSSSEQIIFRKLSLGAPVLWNEKFTCKWLNHRHTKTTITICFNILRICPSVPCISLCDVLFLPSYLTVWAAIFVSRRENRYLLVSLNIVAIYSLHFDKFRDIVHTVSLMAANLDGTL